MWANPFRARRALLASRLRRDGVRAPCYGMGLVAGGIVGRFIGGIQIHVLQVPRSPLSGKAVVSKSLMTCRACPVLGTPWASAMRMDSADWLV